MSEVTERAPRADGVDFLTGELADQHLSDALPRPWLSTASAEEGKVKKDKPVKPVEPVEPDKPVKKDDKIIHRASDRCA